MIKTLFGEGSMVDAFRQMWEIDTICEYESVYAMYLTRKMKLKYFEVISTGSHKENTLNIRKLIKTALMINAELIILAHNHITDSVYPSNLDLAETELIAVVLKMIDLDLFDHIILTNTEHFSFKDAGLIKKYMNMG